MQNSIWKLTALAGVIGLTCLAVVFIQKGANQKLDMLEGPDASATDTSDSADDHSLLSDSETERELGITDSDAARMAMFDSDSPPNSQSEPGFEQPSDNPTLAAPRPDFDEGEPDTTGLDFNPTVAQKTNSEEVAEDLFDFGPATNSASATQQPEPDFGSDPFGDSSATGTAEAAQTGVGRNVVQTSSEGPTDAGRTDFPAPSRLEADQLDSERLDGPEVTSSRDEPADLFDFGGSPSNPTAAESTPDSSAGPALLGGNSVPVPNELLAEPQVRQTSAETEDLFDPFGDAPTNSAKPEPLPTDTDSTSVPDVPTLGGGPAPESEGRNATEFPPLDGFEIAPDERTENAGAVSQPSNSSDPAEQLERPIDTGSQGRPDQQPSLDDNPFGSGDPFDLDADGGPSEEPQKRPELPTTNPLEDPFDPAPATADGVDSPEVAQPVEGDSVPVPDDFPGLDGPQIGGETNAPTAVSEPEMQPASADELFPSLDSPEESDSVGASDAKPVNPLDGFDKVEETIPQRSDLDDVPTDADATGTDATGGPSLDEPTETSASPAAFPELPPIDSREPAPLSPSPSLTENPDLPVDGSRPRPSAQAASESSEIGDTGSRSGTDRRLIGDAVIDRPSAQPSMRPQMQIEKSAPKTATLGQPFVYHILITNAGQSLAREIIVEDRIPKGTELTGTIPRAELDGTTLIWKLGDMHPGEVKRISIRVIPQAPGPIGSIATVRSAAEVAARTNVTAPALSLSLTSENEVRLGDRAVFKFHVVNEGGGMATGVVIRNLIPDGLHHPDGNDLEYEVGTLKPGESRTVQLSLEATREGNVTNRAEVVAKGGVKVEATAQIRITGNQIKLSRKGPARRFVGRPAVFENHVVNKSESTISKAQIIETVPAGMEFVEASDGATYDEIKRIVFWEVVGLAPQQSQILTVKLIPRRAGKQKSVVEVLEPTGNKSRTVAETDVSGYASLGLDVSEVDRPLAVGERMLLTVRARNRGTSAAKQVQLSLDVPAELEVLEVKANNQNVEMIRTETGIQLPVLESLAGQDSATYEVIVLAKGQATTRIRAQVEAAQLPTPISRDEAILIVPDN